MPSISQLRLALLLNASLITTSSARPVSSQGNNYPVSKSFPPPNSTASSITFSKCPDELGAPSSLECGTFSVPINWDEPNGEHFDLGLVRLPAPSNSTTKIGSLFVNPGGPGGRASEIIAALAAGGFSAPELLNAFDIIGLDPRGVGLSQQIECDISIYAERVSQFPETQEEYDKLVDKNKRFGKSCREKSGPLFEFVDTISAVKDHEAVRVALGDEPINFVGLSYGSQLGSQYAQLFPDNIRALILDGILQHSQAEAENLLVESNAYSLGLTHFFKWAGSNDSSPLKGQDVEKLWLSILANATEAPLPAPACNGTDCAKDVTAEEILFNAQGRLIRATPDPEVPNGWGAFASALVNTTKGDASAFATRFDDPTAISFLAIGCLDWTGETSKTLAGVRAKKLMAENMAPLTQGASQTWTLLHACQGWPVPVKNPPKKLDIDTKTTILVTNSDADPSTGYPWALGFLEEVRNKVFVTRKGDGHTSFTLGGETTKLQIEYLLTGKLPENGLVTTS